MESIRSCPLCKNALIQLFIKNSYTIGKCHVCDILAVMNDVSESELDKYYSDKYYDKDPERYQTITAKEQSVWQRRLNLIENYQKERADPIRILDIGCGTGMFLSLAQERAYEVWGIEISEAGRIEAKRKIGEQRVFDNLNSIAPKVQFDVITMWDVIEHLCAPVDYLQQIQSYLKQDGLLLLSTPNTNSLNRFIFSSNWRYFIPPEHLIYFNISSLTQLIRKMNLRILDVKTLYSERSFWQGIGINRHNQSQISKIFLKLVLLPFHTTAELFEYGDNMEIVAQKL